MTSLELTNILQQPQLVTANQTNNLETILEEFPYFQSARALFLKGLKNKDSFKYNQALKVTAAYTTDRSILFDFITSEVFNQNEISEYIKQNSAYINSLDVFAEDMTDNTNQSVKDALNIQIETTKQTLNPDLFQPKSEVKTEKKPVVEQSKTDTIDSEKVEAETILKIGKPLEFDRNETHSFNEWLSLSKLKPIQRETSTPIEDTTSKERAKKFELIDKFIIENPKLEAKKTKVSSHNIAKAQMIQPEVLMTETLARIYVEQKNYKKAIQSYKILSLKYPEKSGFFADQIKAIQKLQD
ncbi:hypothetical protein JAO71_05315 [Olleya sp. YSTF-M6]|uniref:Tetratricopeptide repeat protein n=1 Tax=Olleya sediminilitoris TaxID=2795739 RepID=A0ABS1WJC8_9FLAO|nr:hypothetical protein [Olleya sediminilitoris]MBL7559219.1 hypothetical protein [Olleya sediminilitoris]